MTIAEQYIGKVAELYNVPDSALDKMYNNTAEIDRAFTGYCWDDISWALARYYDRKNDKTRPRIAQILAILEASDRKREILADSYENDTPAFTYPKTNIRIIQATFDRLINALVDCCVLPNDQGQFNGCASLLDENGNIMLNPKQELQAQVAVAVARYPNAFAPFPNMTWLEQLALAVQNHFITLHRRTWA